MVVKTVAIIGAGPSGLVTAKEARCSGLCPTVFEKGNSIGGQWRPDGGGAWENMRINNSRHASSFSDYEWESGSEDFPNPRDVYRYLCGYADNFNIRNDVQLNSTITKIEKQDDKWSVEWVDENEALSSSVFDFVIVCSGIFSKAFIPEIPGLETFTGSIIHARDYKIPTPFEGKVVVIIGNAFSGCEIAVEIAGKASEVIHIFNEAKWIMSRYFKEKGSERVLPFDLALYNRASIVHSVGLTFSELNERAHRKCSSFCRKQESLSKSWTVTALPTSPPFVATSDFYLSSVKKKTILPIKSFIKRVEGGFVHLSNGRSFKVDSLIFCTGYRSDLPFFDSHMQKCLGFNQKDSLRSLFLYKTVFHPEFPGMAFVGMARFSIFFGPIELQARLACMTLSGRIPRKEKAAMKKAIEIDREIYNKNPKSQFVHGYVGFCDELAREIGVLPDFAKLQEDDPFLYEKLWNGPFTTASFRLIGFGSNRDLALKQIEELVLKVGDPFLNPECSYI